MRLHAFDLDGTLAPIASRPELAAVPSARQAALRALAAQPRVVVAFVTGRDAEAAWRLMPMPAAHYLLEHGRAYYAPGALAEALATGALQHDADPRLDVWAARQSARATGALLERKAFGRALHVRPLVERGAADEAASYLSAAEADARALKLECMPGRAVLEVVTQRASKQQALAALVQELAPESLSYVGDDLTDLEALRWVHERGGCAAFVASPDGPAPWPGLLCLPGIDAIDGHIAQLMHP